MRNSPHTVRPPNCLHFPMYPVIHLLHRKSRLPCRVVKLSESRFIAGFLALSCIREPLAEILE